MQELENDGPNRRAGKCKTWTITDQIAVLVLENVYFYYGGNSFTGVLSCKFTGEKMRFVCCSQMSNSGKSRNREVAEL